MPSELSVCVLISGNGSNLQALIDQQKAYGYRITQVISNCSDAYGLKRALQAKIPCTTIEHQHYADRAAFEQALVQQITPTAQLIVLAGFMRILSPCFFKLCSLPLLNIHPALLPKYKGLDTHQRALLAGEQQHGCSVHSVTEALDSGPLLAQAHLEILRQDTAETLARRVLALEHKLYPWVVGMLASRRLKLRSPAILLDGIPLGPQGYQFTHESDLHHALYC